MRQLFPTTFAARLISMRRIAASALFLLPVAGLSAPVAQASETGHIAIQTHPLQIVPFVGLIVSLAALQAVAPALWHRHERKIVAGWSLLTLLMLAVINDWTIVGATILATALDDYLPFIVLIATLTIIAGGIRLTGSLHGTPMTNLALLGAGSLLAGCIGTTGAAMVMIRPLVRANANRRHATHVFVVFILAVANIGGALTPLGDPPLLIGFLNGVGFFWTTQHLLLPTLFALILLGIAFFLIDRHFYRTDMVFRQALPPASQREGLAIAGRANVVLMLLAVAIVPAFGLWQSPVTLTLGAARIALPDLLRMIALIGLAGLSLALTGDEDRRANDFSWRPIAEVATVFAGIFITLAPVIAMLREGTDGVFAPLVHAMARADGRLDPPIVFWVAGALSGFLDNAPTYLAFFNLAGGDAQHLMTAEAATLTALSCGCVFMGALTYVGNAPNMMIKSIVVERGIRLPGFLGYMVWSFALLLPIFLAMTLIFF